MTALALDAEPACPGPAEAFPDTTDRASGALRAERRPFDEFSRETWDAARRADAVGDPVLGLGIPSSVVGRLRRECPRGDARHRAGDAPPGAEPVAIVPLMHRHEVEPSDALTHTRMRHGTRARADAGPADRQSGLLRGLLPRRLRDDPRRSVGPAGGHRSGRRLPGRPRGRTMGRRRPAPPALRRPDRRPAGRGPRRPRDGERLDPERRARGRLPGRDAAARASTSTASSRRSARRSATRSGARSVGHRPSARSGWRTRPTRCATSTPSSSCIRSAGARTACSAPDPGGNRAACSSAACSSSSARTVRSA